MKRRGGWGHGSDRGRCLRKAAAVALALGLAPAAADAGALMFEAEGERLTLPEGEVLSASPTMFHGREMVTIRLSLAAAEALAAFTARRLGEPVTTRICGHSVQQETWISERIGGRTALIQLESRDEATAVAEILNGAAVCNRLERLLGN